MKLIAISPKETAAFLIAGRIFQGLSTACILPNALAVIKAYYEGASRQRAISIYSIGSWGGAALSSLFGGIVASTIGWRYIYWFSIVVAIGSFFLISGVPESKNPPSDKKRGFDLAGIITFMIGMLSVNILISQGGRLGWSSPMSLGLAAIVVISFLIFFKIEKSTKDSFINFNLFSNSTYKGAALSNFMVNGAAGTLVVALSLVQLGADMTALQAGFLTIGYPIAILIAIKAGEKLLQRYGARKPMVLGCVVASVGILMTTFTFIMTSQYIIVSTIGFAFFGFGLGLYATPSADAALTSIPVEEAGSASGIYRMASALGSAFGISISAAIFTGLSMKQITFVEGFFMGRTDNISIRYAAIIALLFNLFMVMSAIISILLTVPVGKSETKA
ncbi:MFS transporter [Acidaminobacter sp.]|uniref:MFS transporter n=1 Tax=Acidaminobacter sp. TaxID=1872102 RepID=UPI00256016F6|nr:MFS transporter [Acidaminobacter sp.]MDK9710983.1 MFS transporter [Acidaminobacter sp.]